MAPFLTIAEAGKQIAARKLSPVALTQACLDRVKAVDATLHSFLLLTEERAMADARAAEGRMQAGILKGPLDGIPIGHKDIYNTAGIRTTGHSKLLEHNVPAEDSEVVRKWRDAGTVLMGKLATHEFAIGGPSFDLPWPPARNPWNPEHFTAGSSSGTGAAVAAGLVLGGRGRIPAARSAARRRCAAWPGSSRPTGCAAGAGCCRCRSRSTIPGRWPGRWRTARCCCRAWRATTRMIRPRLTGRWRISRRSSAGA
jgi:Asp-tRNA(Asn)/Glu-tRNA(Gln) amidotransferase A subunit family amidase